MEHINKIKSIIIGIFSILTSLVGTLAVPVLLLILSNVIDYITALLASSKRGQKLDSNIGISGIKKKISMWILIVVASIIDYLIKYSVEIVGIYLPFQFLVACIVAIWLICNEILSILENINDIGLPLPGFLRKIVVYIKSQVEENVDLEGDKKQ